ncbi:MAG TPA: hypothetical protein VFF03_05210 [Rhodocyclaceae bacterium]|nr:hypothetical protein [Rhodocyclaceae bacterium]
MTESFMMRGARWHGARSSIPMPAQAAGKAAPGSLWPRLGAMLPKRSGNRFAAFQAFVRSCLK